jgi:Rrf2 family nitric oxide-sensitive transcriptional repressor
LRTLIYLGMNRERLATIQDIADLHSISRNHLMKVVYQLGLAGYIETVRGRNGGMRLKREPADINIGELVRNTESDFFMAECFDRANNTCPLTADCRLKSALGEATRAFLAVLDQVTLAEVLPPPGSTSGSASGSASKEAVVRFFPSLSSAGYAPSLLCGSLGGGARL